MKTAQFVKFVLFLRRLVRLLREMMAAVGLRNRYVRDQPSRRAHEMTGTGVPAGLCYLVPKLSYQESEFWTQKTLEVTCMCIKIVHRLNSG